MDWNSMVDPIIAKVLGGLVVALLTGIWNHLRESNKSQKESMEILIKHGFMLDSHEKKFDWIEKKIEKLET